MEKEDGLFKTTGLLNKKTIKKILLEEQDFLFYIG